MAEPPRRFPTPWRADKVPGGCIGRGDYPDQTGDGDANQNGMITSVRFN
jgi:hypothetical protein